MSGKTDMACFGNVTDQDLDLVPKSWCHSNYAGALSGPQHTPIKEMTSQMTVLEKSIIQETVVNGEPLRFKERRNYH
ncbi:hypothetical protein CEXT_386741 [Caerostris extrusa]|uniref:Uncharacterized protein n=1 Tax=Caerostris extrusa TaxID=172846 RepID=A0AAV4RFZ3_CAEEX|nr:hypothetical protein CEXT_386741 [Caerostris extrusa]